MYAAAARQPCKTFSPSAPPRQGWRPGPRGAQLTTRKPIHQKGDKSAQTIRKKVDIKAARVLGISGLLLYVVAFGSSGVTQVIFGC